MKAAPEQAMVARIPNAEDASGDGKGAKPKRR
jgi:hypothetical protein